jgi:Protein of unknown function (DUF3489)
MKNAETITTGQAAAVAEQGAHAAPEKASSKKGLSLKKGAPKGQTGAKGAKTSVARKKTKARKKASRPARTEKAASPRAESKSAKILEMIGRANGATLAEIMKATGWQAHSVRGFLSAGAKKHVLKIESTKNEAGQRVYKIGK